MGRFEFELFHAIADEGSAKVRRAVVEWGLGEAIRMRNVTYPEVLADLTARGGAEAPALWDGSKLFFGAEAILSRLAAFRDVGRES